MVYVILRNEGLQAPCRACHKPVPTHLGTWRETTGFERSKFRNSLCFFISWPSAGSGFKFNGWS